MELAFLVLKITILPAQLIIPANLARGVLNATLQVACALHASLPLDFITMSVSHVNLGVILEGETISVLIVTLTATLAIKSLEIASTVNLTLSPTELIASPAPKANSQRGRILVTTVASDVKTALMVPVCLVFLAFLYKTMEKYA